MSYIVRITENTHTDYIADGKPYIVQGLIYVPLTSKMDEARVYKRFSDAKRASQKSADNLYGTIEILDIGREV